MVNSKFIRILCYIAMAIAYLAAIALIISGVVDLVNEERTLLSTAFIVLGVLLPIITSISLYPIFALSLIETHTSDIKDKLDHVAELLEAKPQGITPQQHIPTPSTPSTTTAPAFVTKEVNYDSLEEAISFINLEYNLNVNINDNLMAIQEKILQSNLLESKAPIFRKRILEASSLNEVYSAIKMHRSVHAR